MSDLATVAREQYRHTDGRFGEQHRAEGPQPALPGDAPGMDLSGSMPLGRIPLDSRIMVRPIFGEPFEAVLVGPGGAKGSRLVLDDDGSFFEVVGQRNRVNRWVVVSADSTDFAQRTRLLELAYRGGLAYRAGSFHRRGCLDDASARATTRVVAGHIAEGTLRDAARCPCLRQQ